MARFSSIGSTASLGMVPGRRLVQLPEPAPTVISVLTSETTEVLYGAGVSGFTINTESTHSTNPEGVISFSSVAADAIPIPLPAISFPFTVELFVRPNQPVSTNGVYLALGIPNADNTASQTATVQIFPTGNNLMILNRTATGNGNLNQPFSPASDTWYYTYLELWSSTGSTTISDRISIQRIGGNVGTLQMSTGTDNTSTDFRLKTNSGSSAPAFTMHLGNWLSPTFAVNNPAKGDIARVRVSTGRRYNGAVITPPTTLPWDATTVLIVKPY